MGEKIKKFLIFPLKISLTLLIIFILFQRIDIQRFISLFKKLSFFWIIFAILFYYLAIFFLSLRWKILLVPLSKNTSIMKIFKVYITGMLINAVSPATFGVDISRALYLSEEKGRAESFASVFVDRFIGLLGIFSLGLFALFYKTGGISGYRNIFIFLIIFISLILCIYIIWLPITLRIVNALTRKFIFLKIGEKIMKLYHSIYEYRERKKHIFYAFLLSIFLQILFSFQAFFSGFSIGVKDIGILPFILYVPLINALMFIPFTLSGLGIREAGYYVLFKGLMKQEEAILLSLVYWATGIVPNLLGIYYIFKNPLKNKK